MGFRRNEQGSMVVEASLILPIFLSLLLFLITLIRISTVEIALDHGLSEATKQVATHMYPVSLGLDRFSESEIGQKVLHTVDKGKEYRDQVIEAEDQLATYSSFFPEEIGQLLHIRQDMERGVVADYDRRLSEIFQPFVDLFIDDRLVQHENLQVTKVTFPIVHRDANYFGIEVRYDMPLHIPFINKHIVFKHQSYERGWVGDDITTGQGTKTPDSGVGQDEQDETGSGHEEHTDETDNTDNKEEQANVDEEEEEEEKEEEKLVIDFITPKVQPSQFVTIKATGPPNQTATINFVYQSGFEKTETCKFDSNGKFECKVIIGFNSTAGTFKILVKVGGQEARGTFLVISKENNDLN